MQRINGDYLYEVGAILRQIEQIEETDQTKGSVWTIIYPARLQLDKLINDSVFSNHIKSSNMYASELLLKLEDMEIDFSKSNNWNEPINNWEIGAMKNNFRKFEATILAELKNSPLYLASSKGGFDVTCLTDTGLLIFPNDLSIKVPPAVEDAKSGARCLAFELFTSAGFHFHRCAESVLRKYFDEVAGVENRPSSRNIGDYLAKLNQLGAGDKKVIEALRGLKDLHRNPLMHPDVNLESADEALNLHAAVRAAIGYMLPSITIPHTAPTTDH